MINLYIRNEIVVVPDDAENYIVMRTDETGPVRKYIKYAFDFRNRSVTVKTWFQDTWDHKGRTNQERAIPRIESLDAFLHAPNADENVFLKHQAEVPGNEPGRRGGRPVDKLFPNPFDLARPKKKASPPSPKFKIGERVYLPHWDQYGLIARNYKSKVLVCLDKHSKTGRTSNDNFCGMGHGLWTMPDKLHRISPGNSGHYDGIPKHIGVFVRKGFIHDDKVIKSGSVGRLINATIPHDEDETVCVEWLSLENGDLHWFVPYRFLHWCRYDPKTLAIFQVWEKGKVSLDPDISEATYLVYIGEKPVALIAGKGGWSITAGVIIKKDQDYPSNHIVRVVGGVPRDLWGCSAKLSPSSLLPLEYPWVDPGAHVVVEKEVLFKGKNLQGERCLVILPTDDEGEIGVQFEKDIGAGSLDGDGEDGKCLFIPAETVKRI